MNPNQDHLIIKKMSFRIGSFEWKELNLNIRLGEYFVMTGRNGSGKSILINLICGLLRPHSGSIHIGERRIDQLPPWERNVGYVPQNGLLFPNRTVEKNVGFGLEIRGMPEDARNRAISDIAELLKIDHLLSRNIKGLSGGERQRICLARALVIKPDVLLLDEPVSAIDESSRDVLCKELREVHSALGTTTLHVSHNSRETLQVADRVGYVENGSVNVERVDKKNNLANCKNVLHD